MEEKYFTGRQYLCRLSVVHSEHDINTESKGELCVLEMEGC